MSQTLPDWASESAPPSEGLEALLASATSNYHQHTDWYIRHRDSGLRLLGALLTAEFAVAGFLFGQRLSPEIAAPALGLLSLLSVALTWLSILSCRQAYRASLEHAVLVTKIVWAMGVAGKVRVSFHGDDGPGPPAPHDTMLYVRRYIVDASEAKDTDSFVTQKLTGTGTTFFAAVWTLRAMGSVAFVSGGHRCCGCTTTLRSSKRRPTSRYN